MWTKKSGTNLATLQEQTTNQLVLPLRSTSTVVSLISGSLPDGMRLARKPINGEDTPVIEGTPFEVARPTTYRFVLRGTSGEEIKDRTFNIIVEGTDAPEWQTPEDLLPVGNNDTLYVLDSAPIDYQLIATDNDTAAGQVLEYYIASGDGILPPGISLTKDGRLIGIVDPILAIEKGTIYGTGTYDTAPYSYRDVTGYDFSIPSSNGFDSFYFDTTVYDYNVPTRVPKKLNRYYQFTVSVSDGEIVSKRTFRIFVVGDDFLKADNTLMQVGNGTFTADNTNIRVPIWITPGDFGYRRANNYVTLFLDVIDTNALTGTISYSLARTNDDGSPSVLPPGLSLDGTNGEVAGRVPYQPDVTKEYKFSVKASRFTPDQPEQAESTKTFIVRMLGEVNSELTWQSESSLANISSNYISTLNLKAVSNIPKAKVLFTLESGRLPPGLSLNFDGEITGKINSFGSESEPGLTVFDNGNTIFDGNTTTVDRVFTFTAKARDQFNYSAITRTFTITVSDPDDKTYSNLFARPLLKREQRQTYIEIISDPSIFIPEYIYRPNDSNFGIQRQLQMLVYSGIETKNINEYIAATATNHRKKRFKLGDIKSAVAKTEGTNDIVYEVVYVEVIDPYEPIQGTTRNSFNIINKRKITVDSVKYEAEDPYYDYTISPSLPIELREDGTAQVVLGKTFNVDTRTELRISLYNEGIVIYTRDDAVPVEYEEGVGPNMKRRPVPENTIKSDTTAIKVSDAEDKVRYISNISNMREKIRSLGETERAFRPLWMRSSQPNTIAEIGYVTAIPICYTTPGNSDEIVRRIKNANIDFSQFDFTIDRYVVDSTEGNSAEQYILFANYQFNV